MWHYKNQTVRGHSIVCTHACACDAIQPLGCLLFSSDRKLVKTHSGTSGLRHQPTLQVLGFHSFFPSIPPFLYASVAMAVCSPSPYQLRYTRPHCASGFSNYKTFLASFISLHPILFYSWFKGPRHPSVQTVLGGLKRNSIPSSC